MAEGVLSSSPQASADRGRGGAGIRGGCGPAGLPTAAASAARLPRPTAVIPVVRPDAKPHPFLRRDLTKEQPPAVKPFATQKSAKPLASAAARSSIAPQPAIRAACAADFSN